MSLSWASSQYDSSGDKIKGDLHVSNQFSGEPGIKQIIIFTISCVNKESIPGGVICPEGAPLVDKVTLTDPSRTPHSLKKRK